MSDDSQRWKTKYLEHIEQQDQLERRWDARQDLLRRGLVRSSLAAEGADKAVDLCMQEMREVLRRDDLDVGLSALIPRLEKAVLDSEQRRKARTNAVRTELSALVAQLQALDLPSDVRKPLKRFAKQLDERLGQAWEWPALLSELSQLQRQILALRDGQEAPRPGLLQRLLGSREEVAVSALTAKPDVPLLATETDTRPAISGHVDTLEPPVFAVEAVMPIAPVLATASAAALQAPAPIVSRLDSLPMLAALFGSGSAASTPVPAAADVAAAEPEPEPEPELEAEAEPELETQAEAASELEPDSTYALPALPEPGYSTVASHVEATLVGLLDELSLPERHQPQADLLRVRIQAGLNLYELVPVLEDFAVLVLAISDIGQREFEGYLTQLNARLTTFQGSLQDAHENFAGSMSAARELDDEIRQQVGGLHGSVRQATDLVSLKGVVESRLEGLLSTVAEFQHQREVRDEHVVGRLQALVERVASMEQEAQGFRQHLEAQRQKALSDPLTGLPNRAAWSERLELEDARWRRYGGDLLLAVMDIDHFKRINDNYGHLAGDKVLKLIASELAKRLRQTDFIARFGGEEFVLLLPGTSLAGGQQLLDTLRESIQDCPFHFKGERVCITLSAGLSAFVEGERSDQVFERADKALYRAKRGGRNRVEQG